MIDVECPRLYINQCSVEIGDWLDENMPNPPTDEPQRWMIGHMSGSNRVGIRFTNDEDATLFMLRFGV